MVYEVFRETVKQRLQEDFGPDYRIELQSVLKNNGIRLDGICVLAPGRRMSPTVYLNSYYQQFCRSAISMDDICADLAALFRNYQPPTGLPLDEIYDLEQMRHKIMMKLVHTESNKELLAGIPNIPYLYLSIVFYLFLERKENGQMTALINNDYLSRWNIGNQELLRLALVNTPASFPAHIQSMSEILKDIARQNLGSSYDEQELDQLLSAREAVTPLYVLTNESGIHGAVCMLYRNVLKNFAEQLNRDLIIIPSSVHEVLLTPCEDGVSYEDLNAMVLLVNRSEVSPEDQLSNHVYLYDRSTDKIATVRSFH